MSSPVKPNAVRETIASIDGDFCEKFIASLQAPALFRDWYKTVFLADGTLTDEFKAMVCLGTAGTEGDPVTPPATPPAVTPPTPPVVPPALQRPPAPLVTASRGTYPTMIRVNIMSNVAATFHIQRDGFVIGQITASAGSTHYDDHVPQARAHTYVVVAVNSAGVASLPSNPAYGYSQGYNPGDLPFRT